MRIFLLIIILLLTGTLLQAQNSTQKVKEPIHFQSILQTGLLLGESETAFEMQSINGIKWKTFSGGIGVGIDNYVFRTIPVFLDLRAAILKKQNTPFVFADAGAQFPWVQGTEKLNPYLNPDYKSGFYFNAGAGYIINMFKRNALILSAAFSLKKVDEIDNGYCDFAPCPETNYSTYKYTFRRFSLKAGWTIW